MANNSITIVSYSKPQVDALLAFKIDTSSIDQPGGVVGINGSGQAIVNLINRHDTAANIALLVLATGELALETDTLVVKMGDGSTLGGIAVGAGLVSNDSLIVSRRGTTDIESAANLRAAYVLAKALTPGGNALSATNRATVLFHGLHDFGLGDGSNHGLLLDTSYVDLIGLGDPAENVLDSQIATASRGTLEQTASDVRISNCTLNIAGESIVGSGSTTPAAYFPSSNLPATVIRSVTFSVTATKQGNATRGDITYSGAYFDCVSADTLFGGSFFGGTFSGSATHCVGGLNSFGGVGAFTGTATNCVGGFRSFGGFSTGTNSGNLYYCRSVGSDWGGTFSGLMEHCHWEVTGTDKTGLRVTTGARVRNSVIIGTGTGKSIDAASGVTVQISNCYTPQGLGTNVTNSTPTNADTLAGTTPSAYGLTLIDDTDSATARTTLGLAIGTNVQAYDAGLAALATFNTNGVLCQSANDTFVGRTLTGTASQVVVTNGTGVSGNPTFSLPQDIATTSSPVFADLTASKAGNPKIFLNDTGLAHGMTGPGLATTTYFNVQEWGGGGGGAIFVGASNNNTYPPIVFLGLLGGAAPTKAAVTFSAEKKNGTGTQQLAATDIAFDFHNGGTFSADTLLWRILGNGSMGAGGAAHASAILDLPSTTKGFRPPCMTTTQKNAVTGVEGLVVYDLTLHKLCVYTGAGWETITSL